jgi:hypothetical protein
MLDNLRADSYIYVVKERQHTGNGEPSMNTFTVVRLPGKGEGWAIFDSATQSTVVGTRSATKREALEAAADLNIEISRTLLREYDAPMGRGWKTPAGKNAR